MLASGPLRRFFFVSVRGPLLIRYDPSGRVLTALKGTWCLSRSGRSWRRVHMREERDEPSRTGPVERNVLA